MSAVSREKITLSRQKYLRLLARLQDAEDAVDFVRHSQVSRVCFLPAAAARRIVAGEHPIKVWREHRKLSVRTLARAAKISQSYLVKIESGNKLGSVSAYRGLAEGLQVTVDDLIPSLRPK
jgi:hypothetical protein